MDKISNYLKDNTPFVYSLILLMMIPVLIIANTMWQIRSWQKYLASETESKILLIDSALNYSIRDNLNKPDALQTIIEQIRQTNPEIEEISIFKKTLDGYSPIASTNNQILGLNYTSPDYIKIWSQTKPNAELVNDNSSASAKRYWLVSSTLNDAANQKTAMMVIKISNDQTDAANRKNLNNSLIVLVITIVLVLLLLANHFKFFQSAVMFKRLKEVDLMKDDFISIASHEMKTPMATIKGYLAMIQEGVAGKLDKKAREHLDKVIQNVERLNILISEMLDVSRLEQGRMQFDMQPYDVSSLVDQSIKLFCDQAKNKNLRLEHYKMQPMPQVFIDPDRFRQVMDNLITNAIKYTFKGVISISYAINKGNLIIMVKDSGIGMSEQDQKNLFTKFYRIKNDKTVDIAGTGLGLWIAREIIHKMSGDLTVVSQENVGSQFCVCLPYIKER